MATRDEEQTIIGGQRVTPEQHKKDSREYVRVYNRALSLEEIGIIYVVR